MSLNRYHLDKLFLTTVEDKKTLHGLIFVATFRQRSKRLFGESP